MIARPYNVSLIPCVKLEAPYLDKARHKMEQLYTSVQKMDMPKGRYKNSFVYQSHMTSHDIT